MKPEIWTEERKEYNISGQFRINRPEDVLRLTPHVDTFEGCAGSSEQNLRAFVVLTDGSSVELEQEVSCRHAANHDPDFHGESPGTIGEQIARYGQFRGIRLSYRDYASWQDDVPDYPVLFVPLAPIDWTKVRRRIEDRLRKTADPATLYNVAQLVQTTIY